MHLSVMKAGYSGDAGAEGRDHNVVHGQSATYNASDVCCKCDRMIWQPHSTAVVSETRMYRMSTGREMRCGVSRVLRDREQLVTTVYRRETSRKVCF